MVRLSDDEIAAEYCYLETTGRTTGQRRVVELWFGSDGESVYFLAGGRERTHWVRNIERTPAVHVRIAGRTYRGTGRNVEGAPQEPSARRLLAAKYQGWAEGSAMSRWARESLPVAVLLEGD